MIKEETYFRSSDNMTDIHAVKWIPDTDIKAVLQICHGMVEHIERYDEFARYLAEKGIMVVGNDHLGHGKSIVDKAHLGYFAESNGNLRVLDDMHTLHSMVAREHKDVPYYLLGHSMGSFLTRQYITMYSDELDGAVIMGTAYKPPVITALGMKMCRSLAKKHGWKYRSEFIDNMGMGGYNKPFGEKAGKDWLSRNEENVKKNLSDELCNFRFTVNGYYNLFRTLNFVCKKKNIKDMRKDLPVLFVAGEKDPVGDFGKGVKKVYDMFLSVGMKDVQFKLYRDDRHEILNEVDRVDVYEDIIAFIG